MNNLDFIVHVHVIVSLICPDNSNYGLIQTKTVVPFEFVTRFDYNNKYQLILIFQIVSKHQLITSETSRHLINIIMTRPRFFTVQFYVYHHICDSMLFLELMYNCEAFIFNYLSLTIVDIQM